MILKGICVCDRYISGESSVRSERCFTFPTTPTISRIFSGPGCTEARLNAFADCVFARKKFLRKTLVHDHDRRGIELIALIEDAALAKRNARSLEIIGADD